jgi:hypothetical protein
MAKKTASAARPEKTTTKRVGGASEVPLRIVVVRPPGGVRFALQRGRTEEHDLCPPSAEGRGTLSGADLAFDFAVRLSAGGTDAVRLGGPFVQGPSGGKFVYVCSGTMAGQANSPWSRRAKVPLAGITAKLVREAMSTPGARLEARIEGTGRDGGPSCATVKLVGEGWRVVKG